MTSTKTKNILDKIVGGFSLFSLGFVLGVATNSDANIVKDYLPAIATLLAAFGGAWAAYTLQRDHETIRKIAENVEAGNKAIFSLIRCYNRFSEIKKQSIEDHCKNPLRHVAIPPLIGHLNCDLKLDFDSLSFLFNSKNPNFLLELSALQAEVDSTIELINERSDLHFRQVQPAADKAGFINGQDVTPEMVEAALGHHLTETMKYLTDQKVDLVDHIIGDSEKMIKTLHAVLKSEFRGHTIITMENNQNNKEVV